MAQVTIGSARPPAAFSLLELCTSNVRSGLRLPQLGRTYIDVIRAKVDDAIAAGDEDRVQGLLFYNSYTSCIEYWNGKEWIEICGNHDLLEKIEILEQEIVKLNDRITYLETYTGVAQEIIWNVPTTNLPAGSTVFPNAANLRVNMVQTGSSYMFWVSGTWTGTQTFPPGTYYLLLAGEEDNLETGVSQILSTIPAGERFGGAGFLVLGNNPAEGYPVYIDNTGIRLTVLSNTSGVTHFSYSQTIIVRSP